MSQVPTAKDHFEAGLAAFRSEDFHAARNCFSSALALDPLRHSIIQNLLEVSRRLNDFEHINRVCSEVYARIVQDHQSQSALVILCLKGFLISNCLDRVKEVLSRVKRQESVDSGFLLEVIDAALHVRDIPAAEFFLSQLERGCPQNSDLQLSRGRILLAKGKHQEALATFESLSSEVINSQRGDFYIGLCLYALGRHVEAHARLTAVCHIESTRKQCLIALANVCRQLGGEQKALEHIQEAHRLDPRDRGLTSEWTYRSLVSGNWNGLADNFGEYPSNSNVSDSDPLTVLSHIDDPQVIHDMASFHAAVLDTTVVSPDLKPDRRSHAKRRLRVGFVSSDFRHHAVGYLLRSFFSHAVEYVDCIGIDISPYRSDEVTEDIKGACTEYHSLKGMDDESARSYVRKLGLDAAVDLNGYTENSRPQLFYSRIAPIQVNYLGYPGTMGHQSYDFIIGDSIVIPFSHERHYTERVLRLDSCYQINDDQRPSTQVYDDGNVPPTDTFVFACFHNNFKINPVVFNMWMGVLGRCPDSVLWVLSGSQSFNKNVLAQSQRLGVDPDRIYFAPRVPHQCHLGRHLKVDLFLDTWPYGGHTSISDVLWVGKPVLAMCGQSFASRVSASILRDAGLADLTVSSAEAYLEKAIFLYENAAEIRHWSERASKARESRLFDTAQKTQNFFALLESTIR